MANDKKNSEEKNKRGISIGAVLDFVSTFVVTIAVIIAIPFGTFIVIKTGEKNEQISIKSKLPLYFDYCKVYPEYKPDIQFEFKTISVLNSEKIRLLGARQKNKLTLGMFD